MSRRIMINCISEVLLPARCNHSDIQLMYGASEDHHTFSNLVSNVKNFINRFIWCGQNTVVSLMGMHPALYLFENWQEKTCERLVMGDGIIYAKRNGRNIREYLTEIRKSEENLQCSMRHDMIEASMNYNCNNFNDEKKLQILLRVEEKTIFQIMTSGIIV